MVVKLSGQGSFVQYCIVGGVKSIWPLQISLAFAFLSYSRFESSN